MDRDEYPGAPDVGVAAPPSEPITSDQSPGFSGETAPRGAATVRPAPEQIIEALLFAADGPLSLARLAELSGISSTCDVRLHIADLNAKYLAAKLSFRIEEIARGYRMMTRPEYEPWLARLRQSNAQTRLSPAALETLSIIAYKQPVIRADIEAIRGVGCGEVINRLREMGLVRIVGRAEIVGRPILYGTTRKFLDVFGLADLDDLPPLDALPLRPARLTLEDRGNAAASERTLSAAAGAAG